MVTLRDDSGEHWGNAGETHAGVITKQYLFIIEARTADKESVFLFKARPRMASGACVYVFGVLMEKR